jgi:hypothetical protein
MAVTVAGSLNVSPAHSDVPVSVVVPVPATEADELKSATSAMPSTTPKRLIVSPFAKDRV